VGLGGRSPQSVRWGGAAHAFVPPNILRSSVVGCARKYEQSKKGHQNFLRQKCKKGDFLVRKGSCTTSNKVRKSVKREGKFEKPGRSLKKDPSFEPISHIYATRTPLKQHILYLKHSNAQRKVYHSMPLFYMLIPNVKSTI